MACQTVGCSGVVALIKIDERFTHAMPRSAQVPPLMPLPPATRRKFDFR